MMRSTPTKEVINVEPKSGASGDQYSDIGMAALFQAYTNIVNSERQTIWQRNAAMVVANSFMLSLQRSPNKLFLTIVVNIFGVVLCLIWLRLTFCGWRFFYEVRDNACRFKWPGYSNGLELNPFETANTQRGKWWNDSIFLYTVLTIALFIVAYMVFLGSELIIHYGSR